jgi:uncharacterized membrane protein YphA (DoxX/SURF4 family)
MLAAVFIGQGFDALRSPKLAADAARPTLEGLQKLPDPVGSGVPTDAETFAKSNAAVQIGGGLLLATGRLPRFASAALAANVIPANLGAHMFWSETDQQRKAQKRREFMTDVSLLGGLIIASADTAGKSSLGWRGRRAARKVTEAVSDRLPGSSSTVLDSELADKVGHVSRSVPSADANSRSSPGNAPVRCWRRPASAVPNSPKSRAANSSTPPVRRPRRPRSWPSAEVSDRTAAKPLLRRARGVDWARRHRHRGAI